MVWSLCPLKPHSPCQRVNAAFLKAFFSRSLFFGLLDTDFDLFFLFSFLLGFSCLPWVQDLTEEEQDDFRVRIALFLLESLLWLVFDSSVLPSFVNPILPIHHGGSSCCPLARHS